MNISQINTTFPPDMPQDPHLMGLLKQAYQGEILCTMAVAKMEVIKPFSDYVPIITKAYKNHFNQSLVQNKPPVLYVYVQDDNLIMSDDYAAYAMYLQLGLSSAKCVVIGDTPVIDGIGYVGEPFKLQPPTLEAL